MTNPSTSSSSQSPPCWINVVVNNKCTRIINAEDTLRNTAEIYNIDTPYDPVLSFINT